MDDLINEIKKKISKNEIEESFQILLNQNLSLDFEKDVFQLKGRYQSLRKKVINGIISHENASLEENKIRYSLLNLLYDLSEGIDNKERLKRIVANQDEPIFLQLFRNYFIDSYKEHVRLKTHDIEFQNGKYLLLEELTINYHGQAEITNHFYKFDYIPYYLFQGLDEIHIDYQAYENDLKSICEKFHRLGVVYFVNNLYGFQEKDYLTTLLPKYTNNIQLIKEEFQGAGIGNLDSFFANSPDYSFDYFQSNISKIQNSKREISISYDYGEFKVNRYSSEKALSNSISLLNKNPYQPVYKNTLYNEILKEFEYVLNKDINSLLPFLTRNYQQIFGNDYDRIEPQIWLRNKNLESIGNKKDTTIFLRNSVISDWEVYSLETKNNFRTANLSKEVALENLANKIMNLSQLEKTLKSEKITELLKREGFEYFEPRINLVSDLSRHLSHREWRKLVRENNKYLNLISFDELFHEISRRNSYEKLLKK